jgi:hypothetical protein
MGTLISKSGLMQAPPTHPWNVECLDADKDDPRIIKTGTWNSISNSPEASEATGLKYLNSSLDGSTYTLRFYGTGLWLWIFKSSDSGIPTIQIDNGSPINVDLWAASFTRFPLFIATGLDKVDTDGNPVLHTCVITVTAAKNSKSSGFNVNPDAWWIEVEPGALQIVALIESLVTVKIAEVLGRTDYLNVLEVAPWTGQYYSSPPDMGNEEWRAILTDIKGRPIVGSLDVLQQKPITKELFTDPVDRAARLLGTVDSLSKWGGTTLTGRDISGDLANLNVGLDTRLPKATTPTIYNVTMTNANTEYSQALPSNTKKFLIQTRDGTAFRFAYVTGKVATPTAPWLTVPANSVYYEDMIEEATQTLYFACASAGKIIEIVTWA